MSLADLPAKHPIIRSARIAELVLKDARLAISCHACFVSANDEVRALSPDGSPVIFADAETFNVALFSLLSHLSLLLARLLDPGPSESRLAKTDIASIPILMRYLVLDEVAEHLVAKARLWTPDLPGIEDVHEAGVREALRDARAAWEAFTAVPEQERALVGLKRFRNHILAHTLDKPMNDALPLVGEALALVDGVVAVARPLSLAFVGEDWDVASRQKIGIRQGRAFWSRALKANYDAVHES